MAAITEIGNNGTGTLSRIVRWVKSDRGRKIIIAAGLIGMALIAVSSFLPKKSAPESVSQTGGKTAEEFIVQTEQKLCGIIGSIEGAGKCQVMVTLENGVEYIYASQQKINSDRDEDSNKVSQRENSEQNIILVDTENGRQGLVVTELQPTVKGVVVVCEGGDRNEVCERIIDTITTALNISSRRVCVTKLSQDE